MNTIKQSYYATKYHKYLSLSFFMLFSFLLFLLTFISQLVLTQKLMLSYFFDKWNGLKKINPSISTKIYDNYINSNTIIIRIYQHTYFLIIFISFIIIFISAFIYAMSRKEDIKSMIYIGLKKGQIIRHFLLDLFFPLLLSFTLIITSMFIFQQFFIQKSITLNQRMIQQTLDTTSKKPLIEHNEQKKSYSSKTNQKEIKSISYDKTLLPYNERSVMTNQKEVKNIYYLISLTLLNALILLIISLFASSSAYYSAIIFCY